MLPTLRSRHPIGLLAVLALAAACDSEPPPSWHEADGYRWRELRVPDGGEAGFTLLSPRETGIESSNDITREQGAHNRILGHGSGLALGDVDGDGRPDVYLATLNGPNHLYLNRGDWEFEEVTEAWGVGLADRHSTGTALADVDGDGDLDLLVTAQGGSHALHRNEGGRFVDVTLEAGLTSDRGSNTLALADVDGDGDLDLYIGNYKVRAADDLFSPAERSFEEVVARVGDSLSIRPRFRDHFRLVMKDGQPDRIELAEADYFYLNDGEGHFEPVSFTGGRFLGAEGRPLAEAPRYWTLTARFHDIDQDGDPDLYVCNDLESPEHVWRNDGTGTFRLVDPLTIRTTSASSMSVAFADVDRDGLDDIFVAEMLPFRNSRFAKIMTPVTVPVPPEPGRTEDRLQRDRNTLLVQEEDGTYRELAYFAGLEASDWSWGALFLDVDLDGYEDLLIATGHAWAITDSDLKTRLQQTTSGENWREYILAYPPLEKPNVAFRNRGDLTFERAGEEWGFAPENDVSHGLARGDLDGDGDEDVVVTRLNAPALVFRNDASAARVAVRLRGKAPNTQAVGARIRLLGGTVGVQQREVPGGGFYLSHSDGQATFAAGDAEEMTIEVDWPSGGITRIDGVRPNRLYEIREEPASGEPERSAARDGDGAEPGPAGPRRVRASDTIQPVFEDVTGRLGHRHVEPPFDDFARQPLLPNKLSQLGPGVVWYDMDDDGDPDLLVGTGAGGSVAVLRNEGGRFRADSVSIPPVPYDRPAVLPLPTPDGGTDLVVGQMNYEAPSPEEALKIPAVVRVPAAREDGGAEEVVPPNPSTTGPLALADVDGDGDLDLFVGGRTYPGAYPRATSSRLLLNEGGTFRPDPASGAALERLGLVSGAVFSDVDADGDPDLVLAMDWGPVRLFENRDGRFYERTAAWGLSEHVGRWNGVTAGDFDGDGRMDLVATSWGRNVRYRPEREHPLALYWGDFDENGTLDLLLAQYDPRLEARAPLASLSILAGAVPYIPRSQTPSYGRYADADIGEVLGPAMARAEVLEADVTDNTLFLNRGGRFEAVPLSPEAQYAPASHAGVADFDGDGREDIFLSQNFYPTEINSNRYDQGRGLWLRGDGDGGLEAVPPWESGVEVYGDQRGAALADFDADGRVDLAVSQNGAATKLYRNVSARPGLRVRLVGTPSNPYAVGAVVRVVYADEAGPAREIHAGAGYWSMDEPIPVLGLRDEPTALRVRWPGGETTEVPLEPGQREVTVRIGGR